MFQKVVIRETRATTFFRFKIGQTTTITGLVN